MSTEFMSMLRLVRALSDLKRERERFEEIDLLKRMKKKEKDVSIKIEISQHHGHYLSTTIMSIVSSRERG